MIISLIKLIGILLASTIYNVVGSPTITSTLTSKASQSSQSLHSSSFPNNKISTSLSDINNELDEKTQRLIDEVTRSHSDYNKNHKKSNDNDSNNKLFDDSMIYEKKSSLGNTYDESYNDDDDDEEADHFRPLKVICEVNGYMIPAIIDTGM